MISFARLYCKRGRLRIARACALMVVAAVPTAVAATPAVAQTATVPSGQSFVAHHHGRFHGTEIRYRSAIAPIIINDRAGRPALRMYSIDFIREDRPPAPDRPVIFIWGGGPGASSAFQQMKLLGPKITSVPRLGQEAGYQDRLMDNPDTVLDIADLVFIDPAGSGFSRVIDPTRPSAFYSVEEDARSIAAFIRAWRVQNGRQDRPFYLFGQSYGAVRAIKVGEMLAADTPPAGIIVTGNAAMRLEAERQNSIVGYSSSLPTIAMAAVYHGMVQRAGRSDSQIINDAYDFATGDLLVALAHEYRLGDAERRNIAERLDAFTGLGADFFLKDGFGIDRDRYFDLVRERTGARPNKSDMRRSAPVPDATSKAFLAYLQDDLAAGSSAGSYCDDAPDTDDWDYGPVDKMRGTDWAGSLLRQMKDNPKLRYLSFSGYHDGIVDFAAVRLLFARTPFPEGRAFAHEYPGGHSLYTIDSTRMAVLADLRSFLRFELK